MSVFVTRGFEKQIYPFQTIRDESNNPSIIQWNDSKVE